MGAPVSGLEPYCTGAEFCERYDVRTTAELLPDTDANMDVSQVAASPRLKVLLMQASGKVESVAFIGGKYTPEMLAALVGNQKEFLAGLVADLTAPIALARRWMEFPDWQKRAQEAEDWLKALLDGGAIFGDTDVIAAGILNHYQEIPADVEARNMITFQAANYFGTRANRNF